jgi:putative DNA primase/helicase
MSVRDDDDLPEIRQGLADRATELFERLWDKPSKVSGREWRWGRKGSLVLYLRGRGGPHWKCYESGQGGDMLAAVMFALSTDFVGALDWARGWLGMPQRDNRRREQHRDGPQHDRQSKSADYDAEQAEKARRAGEQSAAAWAVAGSLAETYLHQHRGIEAEAWPDALGFTDAATVRRCTGWAWWRYPALLVRATDAGGTVTGNQFIALRADGSAALHWDGNGRKLKLSFGKLAGSAVRLPGDDRALLLAEGPETGCSCWWATGITTWCNLGSIARAPLADVPIDRLIVICADDDARNAQSNKALRNAIRGWKREGRRVVMVKPHRLTQRDKSDFNDTLRAEGVDAVRDLIMAAIEDQPAARVLLSVAEARQRAAELIGKAIDGLLDPDPHARHAAELEDTASFMVLRIATGIGKTRLAIWRAVMEAAGGRMIVYLVPTHRLGAEIVERIEAEARRQGVAVTVEVWRGRGRLDKPDDALCTQLDMITETRKAKVDPAEVCALCPDREDCRYLAQFGRTAKIWVAAHDMLWHAAPAPLKGADLVIIDEGFATSGLIGFSGRAQLLTEAELGAVPAGIGASLEADLRELLLPHREQMIAVLRDHPDGGLRRDRLIEAGLTIEGAREARRLEWAVKETLKLRGTTSWQNAKRRIGKAAARNRLIGRFAALWHAVEALLAEDGPPASGRVVVGDFPADETIVRAVQLFSAETVAADWRRTPTLHIDATVNMALLRQRVPHAELVGEVEAATPHMRVVQYPDRAFGKMALRNSKLLFEVWDWCVAYAALRGGEWGVVVPKEAETAILAAREVPAFIKLHHFGATRGIDTLRDVRGLIVVGRSLAGPGKVERQAGALSGRAVETVAGDWYPAETVHLRARDGTVATVEADRHPDPLAEAVRWSIAEADLVQNIGRPRGVNRTAENPVEVVLLGNVPVPGLPIDELRQWERPSVDDEIFARFGAALESAGDAATVAGLTRKAVLRARENEEQPNRGWPHSRIKDLYTEMGPTSRPHLCKATYQLAGPGRARRRVVYDRRRIADLEGWLTERLGPLAYFGEVEAEQPDADLRVELVEAVPVAAADPGDVNPTEPEPAKQPVVAPDPPTARCGWIVDTTGDAIARCGEPITDGRDLCPAHRAQRARTLLTPHAADALPPLPARTLRPLPLNWCAVLDAVTPAPLPRGLLPLGQMPADEIGIAAGIGTPVPLPRWAAA